MDNNQPTQSAESLQPPQPAGQPEPAAQPTLTTVQADQQKEGNKMVLWLAGGLLVIGLAVGGIYWFLSKQSTPPQPTQQQATQKETLSLQSLSDQLEQELGSIDTDNGSDFQQLDQDLQNL